MKGVESDGAVVAGRGSSQSAEQFRAGERREARRGGGGSKRRAQQGRGGGRKVRNGTRPRESRRRRRGRSQGAADVGEEHRGTLRSVREAMEQNRKAWAACERATRKSETRASASRETSTWNKGKGARGLFFFFFFRVQTGADGSSFDDDDDHDDHRPDVVPGRWGRRTDETGDASGFTYRRVALAWHVAG